VKYVIICLVVVALLSPVIFFYLLYTSTAPMFNEELPEEAVIGKRLWQSKGCVECHTIFGNGGYNAPDLTNSFSIRGEKWLKQFFAKPPMMRPHKQRKHPGLTPKDTRAMLAFFKLLDNIPNLGWPPKPHYTPAPKQQDGQ